MSTQPLFRLVVAVLVGVCFASISPARAGNVTFSLYGVDATPSSTFYSGPLEFYGADPTPRSSSNLGHREVRRIDAIHPRDLPAIRDLHRTLPSQAIQVLTRSLENEPAATNSGR